MCILNNNKEEKHDFCSCEGCSCKNNDVSAFVEKKYILFRIVCGSLLFAAGIILKMIYSAHVRDIPEYLLMVCFSLSFIIAGYDVVIQAVRNILHGRIFDEHFLMTAASIGAFAIGEVPEAAAVMLFYQIGEIFQDYAVERSRNSIAALSNLRPDHAVVFREGRFETVSPHDVRVGEIIRISAGERVPLDGIVTEGKCFIDTAVLTGESVPRRSEIGAEVLAGSICMDGVLELRVLREYHQSAVARILELTERSSERKTKTERFITRFARIYTPAVTTAAVLLALCPPLILGDGSWNIWLERALTFLVVSCPCALVVSVPLGFFAGIGAASRQGILIKGSSTLELLAHTKVAVFDKTGTLTKGIFAVQAVHPVPEGGMTAAELAALTAHAEKYSSHPVSISLKAYHKDTCCGLVQVEQYREIPGKGIYAVVDGKQVIAGTQRFLESEGITGIDADCANRDGGTVIHVASNGKYAGHISISDMIKPDSVDAVSLLHDCGIPRIVMLTGDSSAAAEYIANELKLDEVYSGLLPEDKVLHIERILEEIHSQNKHKTVIFAGDGINDAPVLARADVGIAMGALGSDAAVEAADAVIMNDAPSRIADAVRIAKYTKRIVTENIVFALGVKAIVLLLGACGIASLWAAVFADVGVTVLAVLNSLRIMYIRFSRNSRL